MSVFIVAELSANHNKSLNLAKESLIAAKECGADAIKLQIYTPESLTLPCRSEVFRIKGGTLWDEKYLYDLYAEACMPLEWAAEIYALAAKIGLCCFASVFDRAGVDLAERLGNPIYKIASFEITDLPLIRYVASKKKPIILSSGVAVGAELSEAIEAIKSQNCERITLLKCTSAYPAKISEANLAQMPLLGRKYGVEFGLSDHTQGDLAAIIAVSLGASVVEKHFILDKNLGGVDAAFSADRAEFEALVKRIREVEAALGSEAADLANLGDVSGAAANLSGANLGGAANLGRKNAVDSADSPKGREFARSLFVAKDIKKGEVLTNENIRSVRPNAGLAPKFLDEILGKKAAKDLAFGKPLSWEDV